MTATHKSKPNFFAIFSDKAGRPFETFAEIKKAIDDLPTPEQRGAAFESISTAILREDPKLQVDKIYRVAEAPSSLLQSLGLVEEADNGIDRIIVDKIGRVIAVQQKFHLKPEQNVVYSDLQTFFQQTTNISHRLIATTAFSVNVGHKVVSNLSIGEKSTLTVMGFEAHMKLSPDHIRKAVSSLVSKKASVATRFNPNPHQLKAVGDVTEFLKKNSRAIHHSACGTGKTLASILMAESVLKRGGNVLVMEPTLTLIKQNLAVWASEISASGRPVSFLVACSDETVAGTETGDILKSDVGLPVTTDDEPITAFLKAKRRPGELRIVFSTFHSSEVIERAVKEIQFKFDLGIFDEAHRMVVNQVNNDSISNFSRPLNDENISIKKRLFQTATLKNIQVKGNLSTEAGVEIVSMDNKALFGEIAHSYSFGQAVEDGVIRKVKVIVAQLDVADVPVELKNLKIRLNSTEVDGLMAAHIISLKKAIDFCGARKSISFHNTKKKAEAFANLAHETLGIKTAVVHSGQRATTRAKSAGILAEDGNAHVANVRCLAEGMDAPATDLVCFNADMTSEIDITQMIGRCVRIPANAASDCGYVLLPLVMSKSENMSRERLEDIPGMKTYRQVFKVLMSLDPEFQTAYLNFRNATTSKDARATEDARIALDQHVGFMNFSDEKLVDLIRLTAMDPIEANFHDNIALLERVKREHGTAEIKKDYVTECGVRLGQWLANQKSLMLSGRIDQGHEAALRALGINPTSNDERFDDGLSRLQQFVAEHGHCRIPPDLKFHKLRVWIGSRRRDFNFGKLSPVRRAAIEACGVVFEQERASRFDQGYAHLAAFFAAHGHSNVPNLHVTAEGFKLGKFVSGYLRGKNSAQRRTAKERAKLDAVNFKQDVRKFRLAEVLESKYAKLKSVYDEYGTLRLSATDAQRYPRFRGTLADVRAALRENRVEPGLREQFAMIGLTQPVDLNAVRSRMAMKIKQEKPVSTASFNDFARLLKAYIKAGGSPNVPQNGPQSMFRGISLGGRMNSWLKSWRDGELSDRQIATLEGLGVAKYRKAPKVKVQARKVA